MEGSVDVRPAFLVERYLPGLTQDALAALAASLWNATGQIRRSGSPVKWLGSTALPVIEKYTGVLAAADVFTESTTFSVMESIRLDLGYGSQVHP